MPLFIYFFFVLLLVWGGMGRREANSFALEPPHLPSSTSPPFPAPSPPFSPLLPALLSCHILCWIGCFFTPLLRCVGRTPTPLAPPWP